MKRLYVLLHMESIGDTVMKHGQPSRGETERCVGEVLMYSRAAVHRRGVVNLAFLLYRAQQGGFVRWVIHFSRPLSLEILAESRDEKDDHM